MDPDTPTVTPRKTKSKNWGTDEDEQLCNSWLAIAQDPIAGLDQKHSTFFKRITADYKDKMPVTLRDQSSIENRWKTLQRLVNKFCGIFAQIEARNQSGKTLEDKIADALTAYKEIEGSSFTSVPSWTVLRKAQKWKETTAKSGKKKRKTEKSPANHLQHVELRTMAEKRQLRAEEQSIMNMNLDGMDPLAREYYMLEKNNILKRKLKDMQDEGNAENEGQDDVFN